MTVFYDFKGQNHIPVLMRLERAAQDVVRYYPDEIRFFRFEFPIAFDSHRI